MPLVLAGVETRIMNNVSIAPDTVSDWYNMTFASVVQNVNVWLDCPAEDAYLRIEASLDGSKWLTAPLLSASPPTYTPFLYYPELPFGSIWGNDLGISFPINFTPLKRLRVSVGVNASDSATRTANLWVLAI